MTKAIYPWENPPWSQYPKTSKDNTPEEWKHFQNNRTIPEIDKMISCYAAFNHMRIGRDGSMKPCCFSTAAKKWQRGKYSIRDYWFGKLIDEYREEFLNESIHDGCKRVCGTRIKNKIPPPIVDYDWNYHNRLEHAMDPNSYPKVFELEISNLCNMACPMCMGELSSKHMLGRDKDLKIYEPNVFDDDENLEQLLIELKEFIPHLDCVRFTGGEPFAHKAFYGIAQMIVDLNPNVKIEITTNGSIYNTKVDRFAGLLKNMYLSISLDTVDKNEYTKIRIGGIHTQTMNNIQKFKNKLGADKIKINATLMSINANHIDKFFSYAQENEFGIFINVYERNEREHTPDFSLEFVSNDKLSDIVKRLKLLENNKAIDKTISLLEEAIV